MCSRRPRPAGSAAPPVTRRCATTGSTRCATRSRSRRAKGRTPRPRNSSGRARPRRNASRPGYRRGGKLRRQVMVRRYIALGLALGFLGACAHRADKVETVFYPMPPEQPRLQFLVSLTKEEDFGESSAFREFLLGKQEEGKRLARPYAMAHEKGALYIADKTIRKIMIVDLEKRNFDYIRDTKGGALQDPSGIFITPDGYKYVADSARGQVVVYNERNEFHRAYGAENQFRPVSVAAHGNNVYACDL